MTMTVTCLLFPISHIGEHIIIKLRKEISHTWIVPALLFVPCNGVTGEAFRLIMSGESAGDIPGLGVGLTPADRVEPVHATQYYRIFENSMITRTSCTESTSFIWKMAFTQMHTY